MAWDWLRKAFPPRPPNTAGVSSKPVRTVAAAPPTEAMMAPEPRSGPRVAPTKPATVSPAPPPAATPAAIVSRPAPAAPAHRGISHETIIRLPWLRPFDERSARYGVNHRFTEVKADPGETVYEDPQNRLACIAAPGRLVRVWSNLAEMRIWPREETWRMVWRSLDEDVDDVVFSIKRSDDDDELIAATGYDIYTERFEGHETLFAEFVSLARNAQITTVPFDLKSGVYTSSGSGVRFKLNFGELGERPSAEIFNDSLPPVLDFPYKTVVIVHSASHIGDKMVNAGDYIAEVLGYRTDTGQVTTIALRGSAGSHHVTGDDMVAAIQAGRVEIAEVLEDQMPNF